MSATYPDVDATDPQEPVYDNSDPSEPAYANHFAELYRINVSGHVEKKGRFSYLSWPYAVAELSKRHPTATWEIKRFDGLPYLKTECGFFVEVSVTINGIERGQVHPVLDNNNRPIGKPTSFDINTSIQRALVKAIGLHGLGLYIYAGEDLPEGAETTNETDPVPSYTDKQKSAYDALLAAEDGLGVHLLFEGVGFKTSMDLYHSFPKGTKGKMQKLSDDLVKQGKTTAQYITDAIAKGDSLMAKEALEGALPMTIKMAHKEWPDLAALLAE